PGLAVDEVAPAVGAPCLDQRDIAGQREFENVFAPVEDPRLLALGELGAGRGRRVEGGDPGGRGAHPLGHRALRQDFELDPAAREDLLEDHRAAAPGKAADNLPDAALADQARHSFAAAPGGVVHHGEVAGALLYEAVD